MSHALHFRTKTNPHTDPKHQLYAAYIATTSSLFGTPQFVSHRWFQREGEENIMTTSASATWNTGLPHEGSQQGYVNTVFVTQELVLAWTEDCVDIVAAAPGLEKHNSWNSELTKIQKKYLRTSLWFPHSTIEKCLWQSRSHHGANLEARGIKMGWRERQFKWGSFVVRTTTSSHIRHIHGRTS